MSELFRSVGAINEGSGVLRTACLLRIDRREVGHRGAAEMTKMRSLLVSVLALVLLMVTVIVNEGDEVTVKVWIGEFHGMRTLGMRSSVWNECRDGGRR